jgi:alpha-beta hydrolase superfamily lysophospholipase
MFLVELEVGHGGHGAARKNGERLFSLQDQIAHKIAFLELLSSTNVEYFQNGTIQLNNTISNQCGEFILMGHSIGAYIAFKVHLSNILFEF